MDLDLDDLLDRSAPPIALSADGRAELLRVADRAQSDRRRLGRRRVAFWSAGVLGGALVLAGTAAAIAGPLGARWPPPPHATHTAVVLDRTFTIDGEEHSCKLTETVDVPAGPDVEAVTQVAVDYLTSDTAKHLSPDSPVLTELLAADGKLGPITATTYAGAWGYAVMLGLEDRLKSTGLTQDVGIESGAVCK